MRPKARIVFSDERIALLEVRVEKPRSWQAFRVTIPAPVLESLGIKEGDKIILIVVKEVTG